METTSNLVAEERPEFKIKETGSFSSLTAVELLAMLFGKSSTLSLQKARALLNLTEGSVRGISKLTSKQIREVTNFTEQKANAVLAACELGRRAQIEESNNNINLGSAYDIYNFMKPRIGMLENEEVWIMLMNNIFNLKKAKKISIGGLTETAFDIRLILKEALLNNSTVIAVSHNHPSGNKKPSKDDDRITRKLQQACDTMRIKLVDHVIVTDKGYYSYSEEGKL